MSASAPPRSVLSQPPRPERQRTHPCRKKAPHGLGQRLSRCRNQLRLNPRRRNEHLARLLVFFVCSRMPVWPGSMSAGTVSGEPVGSPRYRALGTTVRDRAPRPASRSYHPRREGWQISLSEPAADQSARPLNLLSAPTQMRRRRATSGRRAAFASTRAPTPRSTRLPGSPRSNTTAAICRCLQS
jgi:hypothetical protein